jgi:hypothetical protein
VTQRKILKSGAEHATAWRFGHEGLVETELFNKLVKRARAKLFSHFESFKITP